VAVRFCLYGFALVDEKAGPIKSLSTSLRILRGFEWPTVAFLLIFLLGSIITGLDFAFQSFLTVSLAMVYQRATAEAGKS
jgi:hypothetical protein